MLAAANVTLALFSNYSFYALMESVSSTLNCSVYSLTLGSLNYSDFYSGDIGTNMTTFLPAYYFTNCSVDTVVAQIGSMSFSDDDVMYKIAQFQNSPYNVSDNGDAFVALLFTILGLCVSAWMLLLMFVLLPQTKRKPLLTRVAAALCLVVLTIILAQITAVTRDEYYDDALDMIKILNIVNDKRKYPTLITILHFLVNVALVQAVVRMTKMRWRRANCAVGAVLLVACAVVASVAQARLKHITFAVVTESGPLTKAQLLMDLLIVVWVAASLAYHTGWGTAAAYSPALVPLACVTWALLVLDAVLLVLTMTLWENNWLLHAWMIFLPYILHLYILTVCWEWIYCIRDLELKRELAGMLGRPMAHAQGSSGSRFWRWKRMLFGAAPPSGFAHDKEMGGAAVPGGDILGVLHDAAYESELDLEYEVEHVDHWDDVPHEGSSREVERARPGHGRHDIAGPDSLRNTNDQNGTGQNANQNGQNDASQNGQNDATHGATHHANHHANQNDDPDTGNDPNSTDTHHHPAPSHTDASSASHEVYSLSNAPRADADSNHNQENISRHDSGPADRLPPFLPFPGYSREDYWDDK